MENISPNFSAYHFYFVSFFGEKFAELFSTEYKQTLSLAKKNAASNCN